MVFETSAKLVGGGGNGVVGKRIHIIAHIRPGNQRPVTCVAALNGGFSATPSRTRREANERTGRPTTGHLETVRDCRLQQSDIVIRSAPAMASMRLSDGG